MWQVSSWTWNKWLGEVSNCSLAENIEILQKNAEFELRQNNTQTAIQIYENVVFQSEMRPKTKIYAIGKLIDIIEKVNIVFWPSTIHKKSLQILEIFHKFYTQFQS